jgi:membrane protease YdiL (CAAX protease family)
LFLYLTVIAIVGGLLAWPLSIALAPVIDAPFHRILSRTLVLLAIASLVAFVRATGGMSRAQMGLGVELRSFLRQAARSFALGLFAIAPLVAMLLAIGARTSSSPLAETLEHLVVSAPAALMTGITVGLSEEAYFRGVLMGAALRRAPVHSALIATSLFFAVAHFLVPRDDPNTVHWYSGWVLVADGLSELISPPALGAFAALAAAGFFFGTMRVRSGHIGRCAGFHAGWVTGYTLTHRLTDVTVTNGRSWAVGPDGVLGWLAFVGIAALLIAYVRLGSTSAPSPTSAD